LRRIAIFENDIASAMTNNRKLIFYLLVIVIFGALIYWITVKGSLLETGKLVQDPAATDVITPDPFQVFQEVFSKNIFHPLAILILQIVAIISVSRLFGFLFHKISQPTVIGEIIAGVALGPSLLGLFFPEFSIFLFPAESLVGSML
jgi:hypothetical protein